MKLPSTHPDAGPHGSSEDARSLLSRVLDGDGTSACAEQACSHWRDEPELRATWHEYHLIGDALRSRDLCVDPARDSAFLERLRGRLAEEPAIVAPNLVSAAAAPVASMARGRRWLAPAAVAAGFVVVAGVLVVVRTASPDATAPVMAGGSGLAPGASTAARPPTVMVGGPALSAADAPSLESIDAKVIRDARIDSYLQAHREMRINPVAAAPGGTLRNVDVMLAPR